MKITSYLLEDYSAERVPTELSYDRGNPLAFTVTFRGTAAWVLSRPMLWDALMTGKAGGELDVYMTPAEWGSLGRVILMKLLIRNDDGSVLHRYDIAFKRTDMLRFMLETHKQCPIGKEDYSDKLDEELKRILG